MTNCIPKSKLPYVWQPYHEESRINILRYILAYGVIALIFMVFMLPVTSSIRSKIEERRERKNFSNKIQDAIDKITADGKIE